MNIPLPSLAHFTSRAGRPLLIAAVLLAAAVACSDKGGSESPTQPTPIGGGTSPVHYTAIAASDGIGVGSSQPCLPFADCPNGTGYVQIIARRLRETREVTVRNLSLPAAVLSADLEALGNALGREPTGNLVQRAAPFVSPATTLLTIFVGGNDANTIAAGAAAQGGDTGAYIGAQVQGFSRDLGQLLDIVRGRAPSAQVVIINLPNFAGLPFAQAFAPGDRRLLQESAVRLTTEAINPLAGRHAIVDLMCDGRSYQSSNYSSDGFHPSDSGYAFIADLVWTAIQNAGAHPPPGASCGAMRML